jgi:hypothetical protein
MYDTDGGYGWQERQWDKEAERLKEEWDEERPERVREKLRAATTADEVNEALTLIDAIEPMGDLTEAKAAREKMQLYELAAQVVEESLPAEERGEYDRLLRRKRMQAVAEEPGQTKL